MESNRIGLIQNFTRWVTTLMHRGWLSRAMTHHLIYKGPTEVEGGWLTTHFTPRISLIDIYKSSNRNFFGHNIILLTIGSLQS